MPDSAKTELGIGTSSGNNGIIIAHADGPNTVNNNNNNHYHGLPVDMKVSLHEQLLLSDPILACIELQTRKGRRAPGTCEWIRVQNEYKIWRYQHDCPPLWISGGPGRGKTMISLFLAEKLDDDDDDPLVGFFLCDHQDANRNTTTGVLRGLI
jgi:hypothetical protein